MAYRVEFRPGAENDLDNLFRQLVQQAPLRGPEWVSGLEDSIYSLAEMPYRCPIARRYSRPSVDVRQLLYGRDPHVYKIYFTIESHTDLAVRQSGRDFSRNKEC